MERVYRLKWTSQGPSSKEIPGTLSTRCYGPHLIKRGIKRLSFAPEISTPPPISLGNPKVYGDTYDDSDQEDIFQRLNSGEYKSEIDPQEYQEFETEFEPEFEPEFETEFEPEYEPPEIDPQEYQEFEPEFEPGEYQCEPPPKKQKGKGKGKEKEKQEQIDTNQRRKRKEKKWSKS